MRNMEKENREMKSRYEILNDELKKRNLKMLGGHDLDDMSDEQYKMFVGLIADRLKMAEKFIDEMTKEK